MAREANESNKIPNVAYTYTPNPDKVKQLCDFSMKAAENAKDEKEWYQSIRNKALNWLIA